MANGPSTPNATIVIGQQPQVEVEERALNAVPTTATISPISVNIYEFAVKFSP